MPASMPRLYEEYSRKEVRDIFAPDASFTPGAGVWGQRGIIELPDGSGDFVLFVSLGQVTGNHSFDEGISDQGILRWQSEPKQKLSSTKLIKLIGHGDANVHLFFRTGNLAGGVAKPYTYLGQIQYRTHDGEREMPVHVSWDLKSWPIPETVRKAMGLRFDHEGMENSPTEAAEPKSGLRLIDRPEGAKRGETTAQFRGRKVRRPSDSELREIGYAGELLVLEHERSRLRSAGLHDLAQEVEHVSVTQGDGVGYDIRSFEENGSEIHIEVKTTVAGPGASFEISANEVRYSQAYSDNFAIFRLVNFSREPDRADFYIQRGAISNNYKLVPSSYRASLMPDV